MLKEQYPLTDELRSVKSLRDSEIRKIFTGESDKFVVLVGPCSADNEDTVCEYANRLKKVNDQVSDKLMIIPRVYTNKPPHHRRRLQRHAPSAGTGQGS